MIPNEPCRPGRLDGVAIARAAMVCQRGQRAATAQAQNNRPAAFRSTGQDTLEWAACAA